MPPLYVDTSRWLVWIGAHRKNRPPPWPHRDSPRRITPPPRRIAAPLGASRSPSAPFAASRLNPGASRPPSPRRGYLRPPCRIAPLSSAHRDSPRRIAVPLGVSRLLPRPPRRIAAPRGASRPFPRRIATPRRIAAPPAAPLAASRLPSPPSPHRGSPRGYFDELLARTLAAGGRRRQLFNRHGAPPYSMLPETALSAGW